MKRTLKDKIALIEAMQEANDNMLNYYIKEGNEEMRKKYLNDSMVFDEMLWILREEYGYMERMEEIFIK
jgi:hypothetical protein